MLDRRRTALNTFCRIISCEREGYSQTVSIACDVARPTPNIKLDFEKLVVPVEISVPVTAGERKDEPEIEVELIR